MNNINNFDDIINNWLEVITNNENDLINYINTTFSKEEIEKRLKEVQELINKYCIYDGDSQYLEELDKEEEVLKWVLSIE
jgi:uncharacterized protein YutD